MKKIYILLILTCLPFSAVFSQTYRSKTKGDHSLSVPKEAVIVIDFLDLPGKENTKSSWEVSYELRMIDAKLLFEAGKSGKLKEMSLEEEKVGDFISKSSFRKVNLSQTENRQVVLKIPFDEKIREKLRNAQKLKQAFLFYGSAIVFDAKLKKNIIISLSWIWAYEIYPDAIFGMEFKVEENSGESGYSYSRTTSVPEKLPKGYFKSTSLPSKP